MRIPAGIVVALTMVSHAALGASEYTIEQRQAAMVHERLMQWESVLVSDCSGRLGDADNAVAPFIFYVWRGEELKYDLVKDLVWSSMADVEKAATADDAKTLRAKLASLPASQRASQCHGLVGTLIGPESHFDHRYPGPAKILGALFDTHPDLRLKVQQEDFTIGCVKSYFKSGNRDLTTTKPTCECIIKAAFGHATQQELTDLLQAPLNEAAFKEKLSVLAQRAAPETQACLGTVQKGGK